MTDAFGLIRAALPLTIQEAEWSDPILTLTGEGWSLAAMCPWRVTDTTGIVMSFTHPESEDLVWDLVGVALVAVHRRGVVQLVDPLFELSNGALLELFSTFGWDAWTLRLPEVTIVGPLSPEEAGSNEVDVGGQ